MKKISFVLGTFLVFGFLFVVSPQAASAATNITSVKLNGQDQLEVFPGDSVSVAVTVTTTGGDDWESTSWDWISDGNPSVCVNTSDETSSGTYTKTFNVPAPNNPGVYDLAIEAYGTNGNGTNNNCSGSEDDSHTFTDVLKVKSLGLIKIKKIVIPGSGDDFNFTVTGALQTNFSLDDDNNQQLSNEKRLENLQAGSYTVTEGADDDYLLTSIVCTDQSAVVDLENRAVTINLQTSGEVRCTYTNELIQLIVKKVIVGGGEGDTPDDFSFVLDKQGVEAPTNHQFEADGENLVTGLDKNGAYDVSENSPAGWVTTYSSDRPGANANHCNNIDVDSGNGPHTCTITNTKQGKIIVEKQTLPDESEVSFEFNTSYDESNFSLSDGQTNDSGYLNPGTYSVEEVNLPENWSLSSAVCSDQSSPNEINLSAGEIVTCVFTNEFEEPLACIPELNLLENGGFEAPALSNGTWSIIPDSNPLLKWLVAWVVPQENGALGLEIQNNVAGAPASGNQHAELDGDHPVTIWQNIPTIVGQKYELNFKYSPRPGRNLADNSLQVKVDGSVLGANVATDGSANGNTVWENISRVFTASSPTTKIEFYDNGTDTSYGGYLDDISLVCKVDCKETEGSIVSDGDTEVTKVVFNLADPDTTVDYSAPLVSVVPAIQSLGSGVWGANVGDANAKWIWSNDPYDPDWQVDKWVTFKRTFNVNGDPQSGALNVASDNSYEVWVNGNLVGSDASENNHSSADSWDVSSYLIDGSNTLEIRVKNWALPNSPQTNNPGGLLFALSWTAKDCDNPPPPQCDENEYLNEENQCVPKEPEPETATISALKIVCPTEDLLPNWGYGAADITADTASEFLEENPSCRLANWTFEWAPNGTSNPGDNVGDADGAWTEFDSIAPTPALAYVPAGSLIWVREQFESGYVPFSGDITEPRDQDVSAEFYCSNDVLNYDNYDFINPVEAGKTYHCVGFNAPTQVVDVCPYVNGVQTSGPCESDQCESPDTWDPESQECVPPQEPPSNPPQCSDGVNNDGDGLVDSADPGCHTDGDANNSGSYDPNDNDETDEFNPTSRPGDFRGGSVLGASTGQVLGESCGLYMDKFIRFGSSRNDVEQVKKLQAFLNKWMGTNLPITGVYGPQTLAALRAFQEKYANEVLTPWNLSGPTGLVYQTTLRWINMLECPDLAIQIPELIEWSKNPNTPKEPLSFVPENAPAIQPTSQNTPEGDDGEEELDLNDLTATAGNADGNGGGFLNFLKKLFGR